MNYFLRKSIRDSSNRAESIPYSSMKKVRLKKGLITHSLENVSKDIFSKYSGLITQLIEKSSGVYALYDEQELYYVGRATQLKNRVKQHLYDRHGASWTHFSLYLIRNDDHIGEIESLLVRIAHPKGNAVKPKGKDDRRLRKLLESMIRQQHRLEIDGLFGRKAKRTGSKPGRAENLKGLVSKRTALYRTYHGREYKAHLSPLGFISYKGKRYETPTAAAKAIVKRAAVNGWHFWYITNGRGEWVKLRDMR